MTDLESLRPLVEIIAAEHTHERPELFDDAVQEGMIAAWESMERSPGKPTAYYTAAARHGVTDAVRGRPSTGAESRRGWQDAHNSAGPLEVTTGDAIVFALEPMDEDTARDLSAAEVGAEVRRAVAHLPADDRDLVRLRYWEDLEYKQIAKQRGCAASTLSRRWKEQIRPALRRQLAALEESY